VTEPARPVPIIGVLPPEFEMPVEAADILFPFQLRPLDPTQTFSTFIMAFARLKPEVTPERAELMLAPQLPEALASMPRSPPGVWSVRPLRDRRVGDAARVAWLLMGAVAVFLLIACVNVSNLMFARVAGRQREFAVRAAVGAGKVRLARLAVAESLLLALAAGGAGLFVAFALLNVFVAMAPAGLPTIADAAIDLRVFAVTGLLCLVIGLAIGLWPAVSVLRGGGLQGLRATGTTSPGARPRVRFALVTMQISLTLALLGGSALLVRSLWNIVNVPLGFDAERVLTLTAELNATRYPTDAHGAPFFQELLARAQATPGAVSAALSDAAAPRGRRLGSNNVGIEGRSADPTARHPTIRIREVTPDYFDTFRIPLVKGQLLDDADLQSERVVVLSESAERTLFAGGRALETRIQPYPDGPWCVVVAVTADVRNGEAVTDAPEPEIYVVARQQAWGRADGRFGVWGRAGRLALRTTAPPADADAFLRQIVAELDPTLPVTIETVDRQVARLTGQPRFMASLLSAFAALALLLAAAGLYSVAAYLVTQRRRDTAVRVALGAAPADIAGHVVGETGRWITGGALLGCALGWMGTRALQSQLYQVEALDPWSWTGALLALAMVLITAVFRPAYRAAHADPIAALRAD
jgi:predicted permease